METKRRWIVRLLTVIAVAVAAFLLRHHFRWETPILK